MTPPPLPPEIDASKCRTIRYSLTRRDLLRWHFYVLIRNRVLLVFGLATSLFLVWNGLRAPDMADKPIAFKIFFALLLTAALFCVVGFVTMLMMVCMVMARKYRGLLGTHELEIRDEGLLERTDVNESLHRWSGFHKLIETRRHLYIYVTDTMAHIVPRRSFASEQAEWAFRDELRRHTRPAKP